MEIWNVDILIRTATSEATHAPILEDTVHRQTRSSSWSRVIGAKRSAFCMAASRNHADQIIHSLKIAGFSCNDLSALFPDSDVTSVFERARSTPTPRKEQPGALARTAWWAARRAGFATIGALAIPGIGPMIAVGPIVAALNGEAVGGVAGRLSGMGIPEIKAKGYEGKIKEGQILISVHTEYSEEIARAKEIFIVVGAQDICATGEASPKDSSAVEYASRPSEAAYSHTRP